MMSVVMVMMMVMSALCVVDGTVVLVAMLTRGFEFKSCVRNAVFCEFLANGFFDFVRIAIDYCVERCIVVVSVHTPNVYVVNILYAIDVGKMLHDIKSIQRRHDRCWNHFYHTVVISDYRYGRQFRQCLDSMRSS